MRRSATGHSRLTRMPAGRGRHRRGARDQGVLPRDAGGRAEQRPGSLGGFRAGADEALGKAVSLPEIVPLLADLASATGRRRPVAELPRSPSLGTNRATGARGPQARGDRCRLRRASSEGQARRGAPRSPPPIPRPPDRTCRTPGSGRSSCRRRRAAPLRGTWRARSARGSSAASFGPRRSFL
jgi:hypothetical protein